MFFFCSSSYFRFNDEKRAYFILLDLYDKRTLSHCQLRSQQWIFYTKWAGIKQKQTNWMNSCWKWQKTQNTYTTQFNLIYFTLIYWTIEKIEMNERKMESVCFGKILKKVILLNRDMAICWNAWGRMCACTYCIKL